ncbi:MAG: glycosyltransferase family 4 protein [Algoriphagus sp.]|uniref:glycosyltransferase family 4 protein n=1 Tax=Algoriphagus sp. TaxID=1872435 RepID=UPI001803930B|nr:glycosyltransferase family 4 protein [Algoriphagus sp.]NVJ86820.1 glycosyltransferase family 4 protein [Algoriphagus sp.]
MKIIQLLTRAQRRGAEIFALQLSESLLETGHEVLVITLLSGGEGLEFSGRIIHLNRPGKKLVDWKGFWQLGKILKDFQPDLVQANASDTLRYGVAAKFLRGSQFCLVYRNANMMSPFVKSRWTKSFYKFLLNQTGAVISVAEATRLDLMDFYGYSKIIHTIPIGIDGTAIEGKVREELDLELPKSFLLFMGGFVEEKDPEFLIDWFVENHNQFSDLHLLFLGKGILVENLKKKIEVHSLQEKVLLISNLGNPFPVLQKAKALILPSKIEGLPAVILEAMYCRIPVVAYGVGGISEVLKNGETGWCIPPKDSKAFSNDIQDVLQMDETAKQKILDQAYQLVTSRYSLNQVTSQFEEFFQKILAPN